MQKIDDFTHTHTPKDDNR
jgi:hypothetical protein